MSKAVFILSAWALHLDKQHVHLPNNTPCDCSRGKQGGKHSFCADLLQTKSKKMYLFNQKFKMSVKN